MLATKFIVFALALCTLILCTLACPPTITTSSSKLAAGATTLQIKGSLFSTVASDNTVQLTQTGATPTCTVTETPTNSLITCTVSGLVANQPLSATVTVAGCGTPSATTKVATVVDNPTLTPTSRRLAVSSGTGYIEIEGTNFATDSLDNNVIQIRKAGNSTYVVCPNSSASATKLSCVGKWLEVGSLYATVTTYGGTTTEEKVAEIIPNPTVTGHVGPYYLARTATSFSFVGKNFGDTIADNAVYLYQSTMGAKCTIASLVNGGDTTTMTCSVTGLVNGYLQVQVLANGGASPATGVFQVVDPVTLTESTSERAVNAPSLLIQGTDIALNDDDMHVDLSPVQDFSQPSSATCTSNYVNTQSLMCHFNGVPELGALYAKITQYGAVSVARVATIVAAPTVTASNNIQTLSAADLTFYGSGISSGVEVTLSQENGNPSCAHFQYSATFIICALTGHVVGPLAAQITSNGGTSTMEQVAIIVNDPVVNAQTTKLAKLATLLAITGNWFSTVPSDNEVSLVQSGPEFNCSIVSVNETTITCSPSKTLELGALKARVTTYGTASSLETVATVYEAAIITASSYPLPNNAKLLDFEGTSFSEVLDEISLSLTKSDGSTSTCSFISANSTHIQCLVSGALINGVLEASITQYGYTSKTQVANVVSAPSIHSSTYKLPVTYKTMTIQGTNFASTACAAYSATLSQTGHTFPCTVNTCNPTTITCTAVGTLGVGAVSATVDYNNGTSGTPVQIGEMVDGIELSGANGVLDYEPQYSGIKITTNSGPCLRVRFLGNNNLPLNYGSVVVYDGSSDAAPQIGRLYSTDTVKRVALTTSNSVYIEDSELLPQGSFPQMFTLVWNASECLSLNIDTPPSPWLVGNTYDITYTATGIEDVVVELVNVNTTTVEKTWKVDNTGVIDFHVPLDAQVGTYKLQIKVPSEYMTGGTSQSTSFLIKENPSVASTSSPSSSSHPPPGKKSSNPAATVSVSLFSQVLALTLIAVCIL